jgi:hypothetical protein
MKLPPLFPFAVVLAVVLGLGFYYLRNAAADHQPPVITRFDADCGRDTLAQIVRTRGYQALNAKQKAACHQLYRADLLALETEVGNRLQLGMQTIPRFQLLPQYQQMNTALTLLDQALSNLQRQGTRVDCTRYQPLISETIKALQR